VSIEPVTDTQVGELAQRLEQAHVCDAAYARVFADVMVKCAEVGFAPCHQCGAFFQGRIRLFLRGVIRPGWGLCYVLTDAGREFLQGK
jgi:hypothetical protein